MKPETKISDKIEDLEKKTHISLTKDTTRLTNSHEPMKVDKKVHDVTVVADTHFSVSLFSYFIINIEQICYTFSCTSSDAT